MIVYAHLGHWYVQLAFAAPALVIIGFMTRDSVRRKRGRDAVKDPERPRKPR